MKKKKKVVYVIVFRILSDIWGISSITQFTRILLHLNTLQHIFVCPEVSVAQFDAHPTGDQVADSILASSDNILS